MIKLDRSVTRLPSIHSPGLEFENVSEAMQFADRANVVIKSLQSSVASVHAQVRATLDEAPLEFYGNKPTE